MPDSIIEGIILCSQRRIQGFNDVHPQYRHHLYLSPKKHMRSREEREQAYHKRLHKLPQVANNFTDFTSLFKNEKLVENESLMNADQNEIDYA